MQGREENCEDHKPPPRFAAFHALLLRGNVIPDAAVAFLHRFPESYAHIRDVGPNVAVVLIADGYRLYAARHQLPLG